MSLKQCAIVLASCITFLPLLAKADISVRNNTNGYGTAKTSMSPCSSSVEAGVIKPKSALDIPQYVLDLYCPFGCDVFLYMTKNCSGNKIATVTIDNQKGVVRVNNHNVQGYVVSGGGNVVNVDGGPAKSLLDFLKSV